MTILLNHDVGSITDLGDGRPRVLSEGPNLHQAAYDCVVVAVGFGLEQIVPSAPFLSYWENDNFGRPVITGRFSGL